MKNKILTFLKHLWLFVVIELLFVLIIFHEVPSFTVFSIIWIVHIAYFIIVIVAWIVRENIQSLIGKFFCTYWPIIFHIVGHIYVWYITIEEELKHIHKHHLNEDPNIKYTVTSNPYNEIPIDEDDDYVYQAVATNLRGFPQNIRNGNSFALINTELRWPFIKYFSNYPLNSSFWSNLQVVGFFDVGTAWSGLSPYSNENAYDKNVFDNNSIIITLDTEREPIVAGYGIGCRAMLFGYFARFDWAWGIENQQINSGIFYFSLSLDF